LRSFEIGIVLPVMQWSSYGEPREARLAGRSPRHGFMLGPGTMEALDALAPVLERFDAA